LILYFGGSRILSLVLLRVSEISNRDKGGPYLCRKTPICDRLPFLSLARRGDARCHLYADYQCHPGYPSAKALVMYLLALKIPHGLGSWIPGSQQDVESIPRIFSVKAAPFVMPDVGCLVIHAL